MQEKRKLSHADYELIDCLNVQEQKFEKPKEKRYRNRNRDSILTYEMMVTELESNLEGGTSWVLTKKKSEDDINLATNKKNIIPETKRENKSEEKDNKNIDLKIRRSILTDLNTKIKNYENIYKNLENVNVDEYKCSEDVESLNYLYFNIFIFFILLRLKINFSL